MYFLVLTLCILGPLDLHKSVFKGELYHDLLYLSLSFSWVVFDEIQYHKTLSYPQYSDYIWDIYTLAAFIGTPV